MTPVVIFLAPSIWMNLSSKIIHKPKNGSLRMLTVNKGQGNIVSLELRGLEWY